MGKVDTGWAWVCLAASFLTLFIISMLDYSVGTLQLALLEVYHDDVAKTSIALVTSVGCMFCAAPLAGFVVNATNCRMCCVIGGLLSFTGMLGSAFIHNLDALIVTFGIIGGFGKSLCVIAASLSVGYNFDRRRSVAAGIFTAGGGLGIFAGSPFLRFLLDLYGLDGTFLLIAAVCLHMSLFGMLLRPTRFERHSQTHNDNKMQRRKSVMENQIQKFRGQMQNNLKIVKNARFVSFAVSAFSWNVGTAVVAIHIQTFAHTTGVSKDDAAILMTLFGVGSILSRLLVGCSTSVSGLDGTLVYIGQCALVGVASALFPLYSLTYPGQIVYCFLHGLYTGGLNSQIIPLTAEVVDVVLLSSAIGIIHFTMGIAWILGPYVSGFILDSGGTYTHCFFLSGGSFLLASFFVVLMVLLKHDVHTPDVDKQNIELETVPLSQHDLSND